MLELTPTPTAFPDEDAHFYLDGEVGRLEVISEVPREVTQQQIVIICHPHPLHGGTMNNKVVTTLARTFKEMGMRTVRFNYRGVNDSEGEYAEAIGETQDLLTIWHWVQAVLPQQPTWLAGFSFGSFIVVRAAETIQPQRLISIAPAVNHCDFAAFMPPPCPWLLVQGDDDEVVPATEVYQFIDTLDFSPELIKMPNTSHFFHGKLVELRKNLQNALER